MVGEADDGDEAVRLARRHAARRRAHGHPHAGLDGLAATRAHRRRRRLAGVRVVILTTFELDEYVFEALRAGRQRLPGQGHRAGRAAAGGAGGGRGRRAAVAERHPAAHRASSPARPGRPRRPPALDVAHRPRARGDGPGRRGAVERRDRRAARRQPGDGQDAREPGHDEARRPRPGPARGPRLRVGPGPARAGREPAHATRDVRRAGTSGRDGAVRPGATTARPPAARHDARSCRRHRRTHPAPPAAAPPPGPSTPPRSTARATPPSAPSTA